MSTSGMPDIAVTHAQRFTKQADLDKIEKAAKVIIEAVNSGMLVLGRIMHAQLDGH